MNKVTIDTNCIIDLEEERESAKHIRALIQMHRKESIKLRVVAISASEQKPDKTYASNFNEFKDKLDRVDLGDVEILKPMCYLGICFFGQSLWASEEMGQFEEKIHSVLFPKIEFNYEDFCATQGAKFSQDSSSFHKWLNIKCDVQCLWAHIYFNGDIFVTNDTNFHKQTKKIDLISLGAGKIMRPKDAVSFLEGLKDCL